MRRSYQYRKLERHSRKPAELLLVPMIDIFTVLVTFLLMTAVFSRTVILQLNLPPPQTEYKEPPPGLQLEVMVRKDQLLVADRNTGPLHAVPNTTQGYDYDGLVEYLKFVKTKFPEKTEASILLEPDTAYDTLVQVMDHVRVFESGEGVNTVQAELFPDISIGDAPASGTAPAASGAPPASGASGSPPVAAAPRAVTPVAAAPVAHVAAAAPPAPATGKGARQ
jgi:biopolymer transport protein ExbD